MIFLYILFLFRFISINSNECYESCLNCTELGDEKNNKCSKCNIDYFFFENTSNCVYVDNIPDRYYIYDDTLYKCDSICELCDVLAKYFPNNCMTCNQNYLNFQLFCININNKYTFKYLENVDNYYNETPPLVHTDYYSVMFYNYLETEQIYKDFNTGSISKIYVDNCVEKLRIKNNLTKEELFIFKFDIYNKAFHLNNLTFYISEKYLSYMNLTLCFNDSVLVQRPITNFTMINYTLAKNLSKYSINIYNEDDEFFNDICFPFNYQKKSDVILKDRRKNFFQNVTLCEDGCIFKSINFNNDTINCECNLTVITKPNAISLGAINLNISIKTDFTKLIKKFKTELYNSNFFIIKCYKLVFNSQYIRDNYGFYFQLTLFVLDFILFIIYLQKENIEKIINSLIKIYRKSTTMNSHENEQNNNYYVSDVSNFKFLNDNSNHMISNLNEKSLDKSVYENNNKYYLKLPKNKTKTNTHYFMPNFNTNVNVNIKPKDSTNNIYKSDITHQKFLNNFRKQNIYNKMRKKTINEKISFCYFYKKYIKQIHMVIRLFFLKKYEIPIVQIMNLVFIIALQNTITALFYDDQRISKVFYNEGSFSIVDHIPKIIYSYFIMIFINFFLSKLITSKKHFKNILKKNYKYNMFIAKVKKRIKSFYIKINIYIVINFIFFLFFIYYCMAFCAVFRYNQRFWLLNAFVTFIFDVLHPFFICIIFSLIKLISSKMKLKCMNSLVDFMVSVF